MPIEVKKEIELEIAYVLFLDIVGYSKLVTSEQRRLLELLNQIVRECEHFRAAVNRGVELLAATPGRVHPVDGETISRHTVKRGG